MRAFFIFPSPPCKKVPAGRCYIPAKLENCISDILAGWRKDPSSAPKRTRDGKPIKDSKDLESVAWAICRKSTGLEAETNILLEGVGPALVAVAVTSKPHLDQRTPTENSKRIEIVEIDGEKYVKVPLLRKGIYRHKDGNLVFNDPFIERLQQNYNNRITGRPVYLDYRHGDQYGAIAYLDPEDGGKVELGSDGWLYAYGKPTVENIAQLIKQWPHASVEFAPNYESNLINKLSTDDLEMVDIYTLAMEEAMPKTITLGDLTLTLEPVEGGYVLSEANIVSLQEMMKGGGDCMSKLSACQEKLTAANKKYEDAQAKIVKLEKGEDDWEGVPDHVRVKLEAQATELEELKQSKLRQQVAFTLDRAKAYRDEHGRGHSKVFLDALQAGLMLEEWKIGDSETIKLEARTETSMLSFYKNLLQKLSEILPGQVPMEGHTEPLEQRPDGNGFYGHYSEDELKLELENFKKY